MLFSGLGELEIGLFGNAPLYRNASVNSSCAHPPPPGNCGAFAHPVSSGGGALAHLARPGGRAFAYPGATPGVLTHSWFPTRNPNMEDFIAKDQHIRRRLDRPSWTGQTSGGFLDFMHFFIAYHGTT